MVRGPLMPNVSGHRGRRIGRRALIAALFVVAVLAVTAKRREYCSLCGKDRAVWVLWPVGWPVCSVEEHSEFFISAVFEPLAHAGGSKHQWVEVESGVLLAAPLRWVEDRCFGAGHYWPDVVRFRSEEALRGLVRWDPELAVATARFVLSPDTDPGDATAVIQLLWLSGCERELGADWQGLNRVRALVGLQPRGADEGAPRAPQGQRPEQGKPQAVR
jgi:hypothetical protein